MNSVNDPDAVRPARRLTRAEAREQTRERLLAAAAQVFARRGFAAASVEEIAEAAGFSIGALYSNFGSKEDLFLQMSADYRARAVARAAQALQEHGTGTGAVAAELSRLLTEATDKDAALVLLYSEFWLYAMRNPDARPDLAEQLNAPRRALETLIGTALEQRDTAADVQASDVAAVIAAMFDGLARQRLLNPAAVPDDLFGQAVKWLFAGISASASDSQELCSR